MRRYNDDLAYKEFEPQIQKLINKHISTEGEMLTITEPINIFDNKAREAEVEKIRGKAATADHIATRTLKATHEKMQEYPIYYKKLGQLIQKTIDAYHQKRMDEVEYLKHAKAFEKKFLEGRSKDAPAELADNVVALAFYNFSKDRFKERELMETPFHIEVSLAIDNTIKTEIYLNRKKRIDWHNNDDIKNAIKRKLDDVLHDIMCKFEVDIDWDKVDFLVKSCLEIALLKYQ